MTATDFLTILNIRLWVPGSNRNALVLKIVHLLEQVMSRANAVK
jgi:hypothetical protein